MLKNLQSISSDPDLSNHMNFLLNNDISAALIVRSNVSPREVTLPNHRLQAEMYIKSAREICVLQTNSFSQGLAQRAAWGEGFNSHQLKSEVTPGFMQKKVCQGTI